MLDLKAIQTTLSQLEEERGIPRDKVVEAIEYALAAAYKKDHGKKGQHIRAKLDMDTGKAEYCQVRTVVDPAQIRPEEEGEGEYVDDDTPSSRRDKDVTPEDEEGEALIRFNPEHHILLDDARMIKRDAQPGEELVFPLESRDDFGRIAAQTAKQVIIQRIRDAEKISVLNEYGKKQGEIVSGTVQRIERGNIFVDLGKAVAILPFDEQIRGERFKQGERVRAYLYEVQETPRGINLRLSRSHPKFIERLFEVEAPEIANGVVEIRSIAREPGSRSKIAVFSNDEHIDPVGSCVGQRGVRVATVMSELGGEKIDIIEWSEDPALFIEDALSPARVRNVEVNETERQATVEVPEDQLSLAIGKGGQNVRLAAKLTGWRIDIKSVSGESMMSADGSEEDGIRGETMRSNRSGMDETEAEEKTMNEVIADEVEDKGIMTDDTEAEESEEEAVEETLSDDDNPDGTTPEVFEEEVAEVEQTVVDESKDFEEAEDGERSK